jgi:hypothetical protein
VNAHFKIFSRQSVRIVLGMLVVILLFAAKLPVRAAAPGDTSWASETTGRELPLRMFKPADFDAGKATPLIIYLENLAAPRVGTDSDDAIIRDFLKQGYVVVTLDYAHATNSCVPYLNRDLFALRNQIFHGTFLPEMKIDAAHVYLVPAGSRLKRGVVFYRDAGRTLALDIIYPAHPSRPVGSLIEFSCDNYHRMGNASLAICSDTILDGEATEGLAVAMADHPVKAPYKGLDPMPDCAFKIKAAVRTLRAAGAALGGNGKIAPVGFSRGSGMALMLVTTMGMDEFEGRGENTNTSSDVQGAVVMSGRFTYLDLLPDDHMIPRYNVAWGERASHLDFWRREGALDYLKHATLPLFLTINCTEGPDAQHQMIVLRQRLAELGNDEIFMMDHQPRGHKVTLVPELLSAMNDYLKRCVN